MSCLIELCFISAVYLQGGLGHQLTVDYSDPDRTNAYGHSIGEFSGVVEFKNGMYLEVKHISGINTAERDYGINAVMFGFKAYLVGGK